ncbi:uncharacterized protein LOC119376577 [Rhipicephalus sanguineus]|nr:uncharacterized protein LOC119376577 [Rhipicephalus sanguineus]XP_049267403.1 uncharacterized protein LOC119376577 [Rhipicephalus sanguineus]
MKRSRSRQRQRRRGRHGDQLDSAASSGGDDGQDDAFHLPGFYYDASQRRYFRLTPGQNRHNPLTQASIDAKLSNKKCREVVEASLQRSGNTALPRSLCRMQIGLLPFSNFAASVQRARMASLKGIVHAEIENGGECTYLSGLRDSDAAVCVGAWATETGDGRRGSVLRFIDFGNSTNDCLQTVTSHPAHKVVDINVYRQPDGTTRTFCAYVASDCMSSLNSFAKSYPINGGGSIVTWLPTSEALRSCATSTGGRAHAVGMEKEIRLLRILQAGSVGTNVWTRRESPLSVEFSDDGNLLFVGTHRGNVMCTDLRDRPHTNHTFVVPLYRGVVSLRVIDSGSMLIASAHDGNLVLMDLRNKHVVQKFSGHHNNGLKMPLSYNASEQTVCSAGHDKVVRLWKVGEREPLTALKPGNGQHQPWPWYSSTLFCAAGHQFFTFS